ncbi:hypothetical protein L3X38_024722 [Prunus dulcis]|uniref:Uncharacterized protein n=1 Tax=Prunus dulcis TaxID=3755 RepID=A0AAD4W0B8_PRUDU|nr:hypothetical protein L3X38_024722 [Prunus dulcis]
MKTPCQNDGKKRWLLSLHVLLKCSRMMNCATHGGMTQSRQKLCGNLAKTWRRHIGVNIRSLQVTTCHGHSLMDGVTTQAMKFSFWTCRKNATRGLHRDSRKRLL